ncbi:hypothetical protein RRG08_004757 [Elysia crispata]|uniref:Uncharacterized protein n=1 Tax=Elysia crispata TaxID=231223 RepID=A0AAE1DZH5_9GAST|nr:hypothetical protein RRG08_004757 [Elysia crispata]
MGVNYNKDSPLPSSLALLAQGENTLRARSRDKAQSESAGAPLREQPPLNRMERLMEVGQIRLSGQCTTDAIALLGLRRALRSELAR